MPGRVAELRYTAPGGQVQVRELTGQDEFDLYGGGEPVFRLLDRLLAPTLPGVTPPRAIDLAVPDRDRLLAVVYLITYGSRIESRHRCRRCETLFDLAFSLEDLLGGLTEAPSSELQQEAPGIYRLPDGRRLRLPTGHQEQAVAGLPPDQVETALLNLCVEGAAAAGDSGELIGFMESVAPLLDCDLDATCPECGDRQPVRFDIQSFLLSALGQDQGRLMLDIHLLASTYQWRLDEILALTRSRRKELCGLIEAQAPSWQVSQ